MEIKLKNFPAARSQNVTVPSSDGNTLIDQLLDRNSDLRKSYLHLTKRAAPERWRRPNWGAADVPALARTIGEDLISAFEEHGINTGEAYDSHYIYNADGYDETCVFRDEIIRERVRKAVEYRVRLHRSRLLKRSQAGYNPTASTGPL